MKKYKNRIVRLRLLENLLFIASCVALFAIPPATVAHAQAEKSDASQDLTPQFSKVEKRPGLLKHQPTFGQPSVFNAMETGLAIEDLWPSLFIGAERIEEMKRKINSLPWAKAAYYRWLEEAESVLHEQPVFSRLQNGGRPTGHGRSRMFTDAGHYLMFDPDGPGDRLWDPVLKEYMPSPIAPWQQLQHERLRRLITSFGILWQLSGDKRYATWAWAGLRDLANLYQSVNESLAPGENPYGVIYGGLYESQSQLQTVQALELLKDFPGSAANFQRVREKVVVPTCEALVRWMDVMNPHNMSVWAMAALSEAGRVMDRPDWLDVAMHHPRNGLRELLTTGIPRHAVTGKPDGFWFEHSPFYGCFYVVTPILSIVRAGERAGLMDADLRERFQSFFDAPPYLVDSQLRILSLADRVGPGMMRLTEMRQIFEYAAGQVDEKHASLLSLIYQHNGASRVSLAAVAFGPDKLPEPQAPPSLVGHGVLPEAGVATFRVQPPQGDATLWFVNPRRYPGSSQGHHHLDALSISLHASGTVVTSDLGLPYGNPAVPAEIRGYLGSSFSHNTLLLDEYDHGMPETLSFNANLEAEIPWATGSFRGNSEDAMWDLFANRKNGRLKKGLYDDAVISRTVWFDYPYVVILDELDAETEKRFGFAFHARGSMIAVHDAPKRAKPLGLPSLPEEGAWSWFTGKVYADPVQTLVADWRPRADVYLRSITVSDGLFDAHWGSTPDNPLEIRRGTIYLRAPGKKRAFATVLELHSGTPTVRKVETQEREGVHISLFSGKSKSYSR